MKKISETLLILDHLGRIIEGKTDFLKRNISFNQGDFINNKILEFLHKGYGINEIKEGEIADSISRECSDIRITLHNYTRLIIIDMFSFNDEYNNFFNEKEFDDLELKKRIRKVRDKNKPIRKNLDWDQLKRFRNVAMAHNLRSKIDSNKLSIMVLKEINDLVLNHSKAVEYATTILPIYENIKEEFHYEINVANNEFIEEAKQI